VVASFYGAYQGGPENPNDNFHNWLVACLASVGIPMVYVLFGGMVASLYSDAFQTALAVLFLVIVLSTIGAKLNSNDNLKDFANKHSESSLFEYNPGVSFTYNATSGELTKTDVRSMFSLEGGIDLLVTGLLQGLTSYPFFDPVLTDRCFLTRPKAMVRSFVAGGSAAALFIMFFGLIGTYGNMLGTCVTAGACSSSDLGDFGASLSGVKSGTPAEVAKTFGIGLFSIVNIIMMTTSMSTLDSTFSSVAKLVGPDVSGFWFLGRPLSFNEGKQELNDSHVLIGRIGIVALAALGTLPVLLEPSELSATTASGTVVMGLGPPIYMLAIMPKTWLGEQVRPLAFHVPFWTGIAIGVIYQLRSDIHQIATSLEQIRIGDGSYGVLLGVNVMGAVTCLALYFVFSLDWCYFSSDEEEHDDLMNGHTNANGNGNGKLDGLELSTTLKDAGRRCAC